MATGFNKSGPANNANSEGEVAFSATFTPTATSGKLIVCGTAECAPGGVVSLKIEYKRQSAPPPWQTVINYSTSGSGHTIVGPTINDVSLTVGEPYEFRVVIQGSTTTTTEGQDYFSITMLEMED